MYQLFRGSTVIFGFTPDTFHADNMPLWLADLHAVCSYNWSVTAQVCYCTECVLKA